MSLYEAQAHLGWAPALIIAMIVIYGALSMLGRFLDDHDRLRGIRKRAHQDKPAPAPTQPFHAPPLTERADQIHPRACKLLELDDEVLISRLARALASQELALSTTRRGTLRIHHDVSAGAENVIAFPPPRAS